MPNYSKSTNFAVKDSLSTGDPNKIVSGVEIDTEFNNIASMSTSKVDKIGGATEGNVALLTSSGNIQDSGSPFELNLLQVVTSISTTQVTISTGTYTDISLSATITPNKDNSKILILGSIYQGQGRDDSSARTEFALLNNDTIVEELQIRQDMDGLPEGEYIGNFISSFPFNYEETVSSTDPITYKFQGRIVATERSPFLNINPGGFSSLILMEIAQ